MLVNLWANLLLRRPEVSPADQAELAELEPFDCPAEGLAEEEGAGSERELASRPLGP